MKNDPSTAEKAGPLSSADAALADGPLPSWNDGAAKQSIVSFVEKVTRKGSPFFVPVPERIATFDNDGTLWCEQPVPVQAFFAFDRVRALAPQHPEWKAVDPFKAVLADDRAALAAMGEKGILQIIAATHTGLAVLTGVGDTTVWAIWRVSTTRAASTGLSSPVRK